MAKISENAVAVYKYVESMDGQNITANDVADATGLSVKSVNGIVTAAFQKKGLMERIPAEIELDDGTHKACKFIRLTEEGKAFDIDAAQAD